MALAVPEKTMRLREQHQVLRYQSYTIVPGESGIILEYHISIPPNLDFTPRLTIPLQDASSRSWIQNDPLVHRLAFLIGMVELLSYWKTCCPATIEVSAGALDDHELAFWENLLRHGLGEFFFTNQIPPDIDIRITSNSSNKPWDRGNTIRQPRSEKSFMVLVGGGKDSILTLELLKKLEGIDTNNLVAFALNPIPASLGSIKVAGYGEPLVSTRHLDPLLRDLNARGYLNGHTPFSALLAFVASLTAYINGFKYVLASNESSASEGNVEFNGVNINHQYSKSFEFETHFKEYASRLGIPVDYLSFLRPINELQICALFSAIPKQHQVFRSCNREQTTIARNRNQTGAPATPAPKRGGWCANCPKCVFTYLCLSCFLPQERLIEIFGDDPSAQSEFLNLAAELAGLSAHKPFECVGTYEEVRACIAHLCANSKLRKDVMNNLERLMGHAIDKSGNSLEQLLSNWNGQHFLPPDLESLLHGTLTALRG